MRYHTVFTTKFFTTKDTKGFHKRHYNIFLPQRTQSGFTKDTRRRVDHIFGSFMIIYATFTKNTKRDESTLRLVSFVKPLRVRCGKKSVQRGEISRNPGF